MAVSSSPAVSNAIVVIGLAMRQPRLSILRIGALYVRPVPSDGQAEGISERHRIRLACQKPVRLWQYSTARHSDARSDEA
jgi:hypothetical protein